MRVAGFLLYCSVMFSYIVLPLKHNNTEIGGNRHLKASCINRFMLPSVSLNSTARTLLREGQRSSRFCEFFPLTGEVANH